MTAAGWSPLLKARVAGVFYAITAVTGYYALMPGRGSPLGHVSNLVAGAAYLVVTLLLYELLKPAGKSVALLAAFFSIVGIAQTQDSFFFFGLYCISIGYLIFRSAFFPRAIGILMACAGVALLTSSLGFAFPHALAHALSPVEMAVDGIGEMSLALWLLVFGVDAAKWQAKARQSPGAAN